MVERGQIIILNGAPRSGKSSIVEVIQNTFEGVWMNLGVDVFARQVTPTRVQPGVGLRPGGERPDLEDFVAASYTALYDSIAAHSRAGLNVVVDVGHHHSYSSRLPTIADYVRRLKGLPVLLIGVRCPIEVVMARRRASSGGHYLAESPDEPVPEPVIRWQHAVHEPGIYDLEVDTSIRSPEECAAEIRQCLEERASPTAFDRLMTWAEAKKSK